MHMAKTPAVVLSLGALFVLAGPCSAISDGTRTVIDETGRRIAIPGHPQRIVSLAPSITETVYALGQDDKIAGDTDYCDYPAAAIKKPHVGAVLNPSIEKIVSLKPDLVIGSAEANRRETADQLARLGIPLYGLSDKSLDDVLRSIRDLGMLLDCQAQATALASSLEARVQAVEHRVAGLPEPRVLFVTWYQPLITVGAHSFVADVIRRAGGRSISDDLPGEWPRLSIEAVLARNPDIILLPKSHTYTPSLEDLRHLPGWRDLAAVKAGRVYFVSDTIVRPCPRLVDSLEEVAAILHPTKTATAAGQRRANSHRLATRPSLLAIRSLDSITEPAR
ncbi:MAG TPA: cobalamin-binding protein [Terriglobia bacterium]|nr:cobalamin-binding protein [Terriglobia bacterium]